MADDEAKRRVERFVAAYEKQPETDEELATATDNARVLVEEEPW